MNPYDEISLVLHNLISNVYRRFIKENNQNGGNDGGNYGANSGFDIWVKKWYYGIVRNYQNWIKKRTSRWYVFLYTFKL